MAVSRRRLVAAGASGLVGSLALPAGAEAAATVVGNWKLAPDLGIAPENDPAANRAKLVAALSNTSDSVYFPPGDYRIDNSGTDVSIAGFEGEVAMAPDARFVFTDSAHRGLVFSGGTGARFVGVSTAFVTRPAERTGSNECLLFLTTTDTYVEDVHIDGSAAAGLLFYQCIRPTVFRALITGTMADGLHFANCQDGRADRITTQDTGDDGVAFVNYESGPANTGGLATNLLITNSKARGVAVCGQSGVTIRDVVVNNTSSPGVLCEYDPTAWFTRQPDDVVIERVRITNGGRADASTPNCGLRISGALRVYASQITVITPGTHGVWVSGSAGVTTLLDISLKNAAMDGVLLQGGTNMVDRVNVAETGSHGVTVVGCKRFEYGTITVRNASKTSSLHRAVSIDSTERVFGTRLWVQDDQSAATGYVIGAYGTQKGSLGTIVAQLTKGSLSIENPSGLSYAVV
jgi:hypothetical protein